MTSCAPQPIRSGSRPGRRCSRARSGPIAGCGTPASQSGRSGCGARTRRLVFPAKLGGRGWRFFCTGYRECGKWEVRPAGPLGGGGLGVCWRPHLRARQGGQGLFWQGRGPRAPRSEPNLRAPDPRPRAAVPGLLQLFVPAPGAVMSGFDDPGIFYSDSFGGDTAADEGQARKSQLQRRFKEFLRQYRVGTDRTGFTFKYRCGRGRAGGKVGVQTGRRGAHRPSANTRLHPVPSAVLERGWGLSQVGGSGSQPHPCDIWVL